MLVVVTVRKTERDLMFFATAAPIITPLGNAEGKNLKKPRNVTHILFASRSAHKLGRTHKAINKGATRRRCGGKEDETSFVSFCK